MIRRHRNTNKSSAIIEYIVVVMVVIGALFVFRIYMAQALSGRWKNMSDVFGLGRQYHPTDTVRCAYDFEYQNVWYNLDCFEKKCECFFVNRTVDTCEKCILGCKTTMCDPLPGD